LDDTDLVITILEAFDKLVMQNTELQEQLSMTSKDSRKSQVLDLLKEHPAISILDIAKKLGISTKNVSSQLTYLRTEGFKIYTDHLGRKILVA